STEPRATGFHPEIGWQTTPAGDCYDPGPRGADGRDVGLGTDLRGRPPTGATRVPTGPPCPGCRPASSWARKLGARGGGGRRSVRLLRQYPARRARPIAVAAHQ